MTMRVLLPITTPTSHFPAGATVTAEDITGPLSVEDWQALGHLEGGKKPGKASTPTATPTPPSDG